MRLLCLLMASCVLNAADVAPPSVNQPKQEAPEEVQPLKPKAEAVAVLARTITGDPYAQYHTSDVVAARGILAQSVLLDGDGELMLKVARLFILSDIEAIEVKQKHGQQEKEDLNALVTEGRALQVAQ